MTSPELPKYLSLAQAIEADVSGVRAGGKMPSVRELASQHGVSIVTAARALQVLRDKGLIRTEERSGCYLIGPDDRTAERWALCLRATPGPFQGAVGSVSHRGFEVAARGTGAVFLTDLFDLADDAPPRELRRQARAAAAAGAGGVFFMPSRVSDEACRLDEKFLAACRAEGLAVVLLERNLRGDTRPLEYDLVSSDDLAGGVCCTRHLLDAGCRRVAFVTASPTSTHNDRLAGYLYALFAAGGPGPLVLRQRPDLPSKEAYGLLADEVLALKADGVVCYQDYTALGLVMELLTRGVAVPGDVAVAGFDDLPIGSLFAIGVTTYGYPWEGIAREALRVMRRRVAEPDAAPVQVVVPGRLIVRESSTRAASNGNGGNGRGARGNGGERK
jgi:LacI family transcriptional regulator